MLNNRVAITGLGPVSAIGVGKSAFQDGLIRAASGIHEITLFDAAPYRSKTAAEVGPLDMAGYLRSQKTYLDRSSELALAATSLAVADAGLDPASLAEQGAGLLLGSAFGSLDTVRLFFTDVLTKGPRFAKPILFPHAYPNTPISIIAIDYGLTGYHLNFASGATSSSCAILEAYDLIRQGRIALAIAGGYEALSETLFAGLDLANGLSPGNGGVEKCAPFDLNRNGPVLGEGAGLVVLEELGRAEARNARVYAEIAGACAAGESSIGGNGADSWTAIADTIRTALRDLPFNPGDLDYISANANGSVELDLNEARAIADAAPGIPAGSIKSMIGETLGAGGALQMIAAAVAFETGQAPPTVNLDSPAETGDIEYVIGKPLVKKMRRMLLNAMDAGGSIVSFVLRDAGL